MTGSGVTSPLLRFSAAPLKNKMIIRRHETVTDKIWRYLGYSLLAGLLCLLHCVVRCSLTHLLLCWFLSRLVPDTGVLFWWHVSR
jgi:hypothetical protein